MKKDALKQQVLSIIVGKLTDAGWKEIGTAPQVMNKRYATAVGCKEAQIRIDQGSNDKWWVNGWYWSEGNNVLAALDLFIPSVMGPALVALNIDAYLVDVEMRIGYSYAARLLHPVQPGKALEGEVLPP